MKQKFTIGVIPGDGVGPEVTAEGVKALKTIAEVDGSVDFEFTYYPWGCDYYLKNGIMMDEDGLQKLADHDAILLGAVGDPRVPDHISLWELLLKIRKGFDQYINLRPVKLLKGAPCPLAQTDRSQIDMIFVRENSEGEYSGKGRWTGKNTDSEMAVQEDIFTRKGCERVMRYAYMLASEKGKSLTSVTKSNAINYSMVFWDKIFNELKAEFPRVETHSCLVDAAAMYMIKEPERFQVVVTSNLFGDILTDLGAAIAGGMGLAAGANINPEKKYPSMFEPIHGSAPDIAGKNIADPLATIWAVSQMLEHLGLRDWAKLLIDIIEEVLDEKQAITPDLGGTAKTSETGERVAEKIRMKFTGGKDNALG